MKYYDLVFEVGIAKRYFPWVLRTVDSFRALLKAPCVVRLSSVLLAVYLSFNSDDYFFFFFALFIPLVP